MVYEYWFSKIWGISSNKKSRLREYYGDGKAIYYIEEKRQKFPDFLNDREKHILNQAKKETGFDPEDFNLKIEALVMADTNFIFTITKINPDIEKDRNSKKKFTIKRKSLSTSSTLAIYSFNSFEDFCSFLQFLKENKIYSSSKKIAKSISLYFYKGKYYLLLNQINSEIVLDKKFYTSITEFAKYVTNSDIFASKLKECGNLIMKDTALEIGLKHFV